MSSSGFQPAPPVKCARSSRRDIHPASDRPPPARTLLSARAKRDLTLPSLPRFGRTSSEAASKKTQRCPRPGAYHPSQYSTLNRRGPQSFASPEGPSSTPPRFHVLSSLFPKTCPYPKIRAFPAPTISVQKLSFRTVDGNALSGC